MNRAFFTFCCLAVGVGTYAQETQRFMHINLHNGQSLEIATNQVDDITFSQKEILPVDANEHEYVDLGLPSGTLWATCNVGAETPEEIGFHFAWGETEVKDVYSWTNYAFVSQEDYLFTAYTTDEELVSESSELDNQTQLLPCHDAAFQAWGGSWRLPTREQWWELHNYCGWYWDIDRKGMVVTGRNGEQIFLPANGFKDEPAKEEAVSSITFLYETGYYWSADLSLRHGEGYDASLYYFHDEVHSNYDYSRSLGLGVRAVLR